jgi:predicted O-methyltransferase YrrM
VSILSSVLDQVLRAFGRGGAPLADAEDFARISTRFPALDAIAEAAVAGSRLLAEPHRKYVGAVSAPEWAVSLETAALLHGICTLLQPRAVLDLGSGFSSYALRCFARDAARPCTVHSVDEDAQWLERTRNFLALHGLPAEGTYTWQDFQVRITERYDLILHDMGRIQLRIEALPQALALAAADGLVVLDDMNSPEYARAARERCRAAGFDLCSVRPITFDSIGRYAGVAFRPRAG